MINGLFSNTSYQTFIYASNILEIPCYRCLQITWETNKSANSIWTEELKNNEYLRINEWWNFYLWLSYSFLDDLILQIFHTKLSAANLGGCNLLNLLIHGGTWIFQGEPRSISHSRNYCQTISLHANSIIGRAYLQTEFCCLSFMHNLYVILVFHLVFTAKLRLTTVCTIWAGEVIPF